MNNLLWKDRLEKREFNYQEHVLIAPTIPLPLSRHQSGERFVGECQENQEPEKNEARVNNSVLPKRSLAVSLPVLTVLAPTAFLLLDVMEGEIRTNQNSNVVRINIDKESKSCSLRSLSGLVGLTLSETNKFRWIVILQWKLRKSNWQCTNHLN